MTYLDLPKEFSSYKTSRVAVLPAPFEATTSYVKGTANGPKAILNASAQVELYDEELGRETHEIGISTIPALSFKGLETKEALASIKEAVGSILKDNKLPVMLGGEHTVTPAAVMAVANKYPSVTVLQFDAHADLREEYEGTKWSHACAMARVREICPVVQVGIRNLSIAEAKLVEREKLPVFFAYKIREDKNWIEHVLQTIKTKDVYVTFDVDAFDSSILPDTGTPEPGGLNWWDVTSLIKTVAGQKNIVGFDFVELAPCKGHHASDFLVAKLIYKCIGYYSSVVGRR